MRSLIPWRRRHEVALQALWPEMESLFHRFFSEPEEGPGEGRSWAPRVDVEETDKELIIKADLPGVEPKDVDVSVSDGTLVLRGEKKETHETKKKDYRCVERYVGKFYREIPLPEGVDRDKIAASSAKGVVTVTIPKKPEVQPRKISVKAEG